jgi:hypothetical protein
MLLFASWDSFWSNLPNTLIGLAAVLTALGALRKVAQVQKELKANTAVTVETKAITVEAAKKADVAAEKADVAATTAAEVAATTAEIHSVVNGNYAKAREQLEQARATISGLIAEKSK